MPGLNGFCGEDDDCFAVELVTTFLALAAGELSVEMLTDWFRAHVVPV